MRNSAGKDAAAASTMPSPPSSTTDGPEWKRDVKILACILLASTLLLAVALYVLVVSVLSDAEWEKLRLPTSLEAAQQLGEALKSFATRSNGRLLVAHMCCYLYLQTFAIPGTVFFNLLGGALFGIAWGFPLCLSYNTLGSVFMYLLSKHFGKRAVLHLFPEKLGKLRGMIDSHRDDLGLYMIFLRVFPFTPNWFINMASPHLEIPLLQFTVGPLVGLIPYNFLSCKAGLILSSLRSKGDIIDTPTTVQLIAVAIVGAIVLPRLKKRFAAAPPSPKRD
ncbi:Membrane protein, partial [Globisporangium splendens]